MGEIPRQHKALLYLRRAVRRLLTLIPTKARQFPASNFQQKEADEVLTRLEFLEIDHDTLRSAPNMIYPVMWEQVNKFKKQCLGTEPERIGRAYPLVLTVGNRTCRPLSGMLKMEVVIPGWKNETGSTFSMDASCPLQEVRAGETHRIMLIELSNIPLLRVYLRTAEFYESGKRVEAKMTGHRSFVFKTTGDFLISSASSKIDDEEDERNIERIEHEIGFENYFLLKTYLDLPVYERGIILRILFDRIEDIRKGRVLADLTPDRKVAMQHLLQIEIISKICMMIEDLGLFSVSMRTGIKDLCNIFFDEGSNSSNKVGQFYRDLDEFNDEDFLRVLSFPTADSLRLSASDYEVVNEVLESVQQEARRVYNEIAKFRKQHWTLYNKYKHGFAIIPYVQKTAGNIDFLADVESAVLVLHDKRSPWKEGIAIPYSARILEGYRILIIGIQTLLKNILENQLNVLENPNLINLPMPSEGLTADKRSRYAAVTKRFQPAKEANRDHRIHTRASAKRDDLKWYADLPKFLEGSAERGKRQQSSRPG